MAALASLEKLNLENSAIRSLPPSIGRLQNLNELGLIHTYELVNLPEEIGDLVNLTKLNLTESSLVSLPSSMGRLQNLKHLHLECMEKLVNLPEDILNLANLHCYFGIDWG